MCGIAGIVHFDGRPIDAARLTKMIRQLRHRGPDGHGYLFSDRRGKYRVVTGSDSRGGDSGFVPTLAIGHARLSIIDLEGGFQPLSNEDGSVWVTFNGEIYNHSELRDRLAQLGHKFRTSHCDTEVIVHAYEEWGKDCLSLFRGMFSLCLVDFAKQRLILARDRLGVKPLYFSANNRSLIFASELTAVSQGLDSKQEIDPQSLSDYLIYQYIPAPSTIYKEIKKLIPGTYMEFDMRTGDSSDHKSYWELHRQEPAVDYNEEKASEELLDLLCESVRLRMVADVPVGAFLSGGVDSASVVALMREASPGTELRTFSIGFEEREFNELDGARFIAERFGTVHEECIMGMDSLDLIPEIARSLDEPLADSSILPTYLVSKMAAAHLKVVLSGDGGDEAFGGYPRYRRALLFHNLIEPLPLIMRKLSSNILMPFSSYGALREIAVRLPLTLGRFYARGVCFFTPEELCQIMRPHVLDQISIRDASWLYQMIDGQKDAGALHRLRFADMASYLPGAVLTKVDRASMAWSLEVRSPFLDHKIHEFSAGLPSHALISGRIQKYILKKALAGHLPKHYLERPKKGFGVPLDNWFRTRKGLGIIRETLSPDSYLSDWIDMENVAALIASHKEGHINGGFKIWSLLMLEHWLRGAKF